MRTYTLSDAARAAGVSVGRLRMQYARGSFATFRAEHEPEFAGDARLLSANTVLAIAIANALAGLGVALDRAAAAGDMFAHTNSGRPQRSAPAALYPGSVATVLAVSGNGEIQMFPAGQGRDIEFLTVMGDAGATFITVDPIVERVTRALT